MLADVSVGVGTVGVAVGIDDGEPVLVFVTGALLTAPASALTAGELAKLFAWCLVGAVGFIEYELEMTGILCTTLVPWRVIIRLRTTRRTVDAGALAVRVAGCAAGIAGGLTSRGTAMSGNWTAGSETAGIATGTAGTDTSARIAAARTPEYGSASANMPTTANQ